jgi:predicted permease
MRRSIGDGIRVGVKRLFTPAVRTEARSKADLEDELRSHIDARVEYLVARGHSPEAARAEAERRFGNLNETVVLLQESAVEKERRLSLRERFASLRQDARFVLRGLGRSPAFTAGVIATLTLGLGINSAVFRIADRVLLRAPTGVVDASSIRRVGSIAARVNGPVTEVSTFSYPEARTLIDSRAFGAAAIYATGRVLKLADGREIAGAYVDSGFFHLLGVHASVGRLFDSVETSVGSSIPVVVVSHAYWERELGAAPLTPATTIKMNDKPYLVVGVTSRGFTGIDLDPVDVWLPLGVGEFGRATINGVVIPWYRTTMSRPLRVLGKIPSGATDAKVASQAAAPLAGIDRESGRAPRTIGLHSLMSSSDLSGKDSTSRLIGRLAGVALVVLLIACANAANLLLARALRRRREIAVRLALGGSRTRIVRLLIVESVVLGLAGGVAAALAGYWTGEGLRRLLFPDARWTTAAFDDRALGFTLLVALVAGLVAGLAPSLQLTNPDLVSSLKDNRYQPGRRSHRTRAVLVVLQTAFSLALLIASGLLVRSLQKLNAINIGFDPDGLVTVLAPSGRGRFGGVLNPMPAGQAVVTAEQLADRMAKHPDVRSVALASTVPFGAHSSMGIKIPGRADEVESDENGPYYIAVSPDYFKVMGTRLVRGRLFSSTDVEGSDPVAIVNETMARHLWKGESPFGTCILFGGGVCAQVIGIVEDVRDTRGGGMPPLRFYLPLAQRDEPPDAIVMRVPPEKGPALAATLKTIVPAAQRPQIEVISDRINLALRPWRLATMLFMTLGGVALALACVGVYSVMSYIASERIHELGVRIVLGAQASDIVRLVLAGGFRLIVAGGVLGLIGASLSARLLSSLLFGVSPTDATVYAASIVILAVIGIVATLVPALRVMRTDPTVALRSE